MSRTPLQVVRASVLLVVMAVSASAGLACPYSIRDAGFIVRDPSPYHLYVCVDDRTPGREHAGQWIEAAAAEYLGDSNVKAEVVNLDRAPDHQAAAAVASLGIERLPAAVLVSPGTGAVEVPGLAANRLLEQDVRAAAVASVSSPKRAQLKDHLVQHWCVMVLAEGTDSKANQRARTAARAAARRVVGTTTELGQTVETAPYLLSLPADDPTEAVLLTSLGLHEGDAPDPRLAVAFGAGRRLGPVLRGAEIAESSVSGHLQTLGRSCTCTSDPGQLLGPSVPMVWDDEVRAEAREALGFDPEKPEVRMVLAGVWQSQMMAGAAETEAFGYADEYVEFPVEASPRSLTGNAERPEPGPSLGKRTARALIVALAVVAVVVAGVGTALLLRRASSPR